MTKWNLLSIYEYIEDIWDVVISNINGLVSLKMPSIRLWSNYKTIELKTLTTRIHYRFRMNRTYRLVFNVKKRRHASPKLWLFPDRACIHNKIDIDDACNYKLWVHESEMDLSKFTQDANCQILLIIHLLYLTYISKLIKMKLYAIIWQ